MYGNINKMQLPFRYILNGVQNFSRHNSIKTGNNKVFSNISKYLNNTKHITPVHKEFQAVCSLIKRSGLNDLNKLPYYLNQRNYHTTPSRCQQQPSQNPNDPKKDPNKDDDEDNKISSLLAKAFLWMLSAYMVIAIISLMFPSSNQPEVVRYVSWNEFLYQMLAKGEVEEIIVRPDVDIVTIILYDGAIIKGKKVR
ncbi:hypothetical protein AMK59_3148 [Oryctes borbonicus]|uniref:Peptidase M41 FtsH extracellular domain-containing protein n=1 Tax=Oryctes borbonicus TaxID=1629725 RepID=A0A0T6B633_9SCAR|nr:hypothetical protein AMK59_3148 [Oryctes borbonicus]